ncbi:MAG: hypothetical protein U0694_12835 [Anaerolineae bacterium]
MPGVPPPLRRRWRRNSRCRHSAEEETEVVRVVVSARNARVGVVSTVVPEVTPSESRGLFAIGSGIGSGGV